MSRNITKEQQKQLAVISAFLKEFRLQSGLTQKQLAEYAEVDRTTIIRAESGIDNISFLTLLQLCEGLDLPIREMFWE